MTDTPPTYCTNVHAGRTLEETEANLERFSTRVRELAAPKNDPDAPIGLGLWLSAASARELREAGGAKALRDRLLARNLQVVTLNGFPYGDFHAEVVKHAVYEPHWADPRRLAYTIDLAHLLADLLPDGTTDASISTLPVGWRADFTNEGCGCSVGLAAAQLVEAAKALRESIEDYDIIMTDLSMPEIGGLDIVRIVREQDPSKPVILASGYNDSSLVDDDRVWLLSKPYSQSELKSTLQLIDSAAIRVS